MCKFKLVPIILTIATLLTGSTCFARENNGSDTVVIFRNYKVTLHETSMSDTDKVMDPVTGNVMLKSIPVYEPLYVDGIAVEREAVPENMSKKLQQYINEQLENSPIIKSLPDGRVTIRLRNIVMTQKGELAYYELTVMGVFADGVTRFLSNNILTAEMISEGVGSMDGQSKAKYSLLMTDLSKSSFIVKGGRVRFER